MSDAVRQKYFDIGQGKTYYELTDTEVGLLNQALEQAGQPALVFAAPGPASPVAAEEYVVHTGDPDCALCKDKGVHLVHN